MNPSYVSWIGGFDVGSRVAQGDDPGKDNLMNSPENLLGMHLDQFSVGVEAVGQSGNVFTFKHRVPNSPAADLSLFYEWSIDPQKWNDSGKTFGGIQVSIISTVASDTATVTATVTKGSTSKLMVRARATQR